MLQEGIFFEKGTRPGNSFSIVFLRIAIDSTVSDIGRVLSKIWKMNINLKKGIRKDLEVNERHLHKGNLSVLFGYSPNIFTITGVRKTIPENFATYGSFKIPEKMGGGPLLEGSDLHYAKEVRENHAAADHIAIQFIADSEFITSRAIVETWKEIRSYQKETGKKIIEITKFYSGFQSADQRNWLGFHDGISNIKSKERKGVICIADSNKLGVVDKWIINGTYLAFLRLSIDLDTWQNLDLIHQELVIGRDKFTGCPLIGLDKNGKPIKEKRCPVHGTFEVIEKGNEQFRAHPPFGHQMNLPIGVNDQSLKSSHVERALESNKRYPQESESFQIFRQSFQFIENFEPGFRVGLNFVSFQETPQRITNVLKYGFRRSKEYSNNSKAFNALEDYTAVHAAGIFLIPPVIDKEPFPGATIFLDSTSLAIDVKTHREYGFSPKARF